MGRRKCYKINQRNATFIEDTSFYELKDNLDVLTEMRYLKLEHPKDEVVIVGKKKIMEIEAKLEGRHLTFLKIL